MRQGRHIIAAVNAHRMPRNLFQTLHTARSVAHLPVKSDLMTTTITLHDAVRASGQKRGKSDVPRPLVRSRGWRPQLATEHSAVREEARQLEERRDPPEGGDAADA